VLFRPVSVPLHKRGAYLAVALAAAAAVALPATSAEAAASAPKPTTSYTFTSATGDYIGQGAAASYTAPAATIAVSGTLADLTVSVTSGSDWWYIDLGAPRGQQLHAGVYYNAERDPFRTGLAPGLNVFGDGRGCNNVYGQFSINQIGTDPNGAVTLLDATFAQHCEAAKAPALHGHVRVNAYPLSYAYKSDAGDYIGAGTSRSYAGDTTLFGLTGTVTGGVQFSVSGLRDTWTVWLMPPAGGRLKVGTFANTRRAPFQTGTSPGLDVSGNGRGCNTSTGSFTISVLSVDTSGTVTAIAGSYVQHCEGVVPALHGTFHYLA
jgi:hypothetical protein